MNAVLDVRNLDVTYAGGHRAVHDVSFAMAPGEMVGLVGESGSGKSTLGLAVMRLLGTRARIAISSRVSLEGRQLLDLDEREMCAVRGRRMSMVFQEPAAALNPVMRVGDQIAEVVRLHGERSRRAALERAIVMMERTGVPQPGRRANAYPHELSGGLRQRVMIAMALVLQPAVIIADEPTSALDVTVQAQILELLLQLQRESGTAVLLITHDLGIVAEACSRALVMRAGALVEAAPVDQLFRAPAHPYTAELLRAVPRIRPSP
jgi:ABC-type dipeptide/oligopeptide/nickel transport system ATPase component